MPCDCGRCYVGETSRPLEERIKEHKYNLMQGLLEESKLTKHACEEGNEICWKEAKILQIEPNATYRKYKESANMSLVAHPISWPSLDVSPIWTFIIEVEVRKLQLREVKILWESYIFMLVLHRCLI
jgi:hypothetical protein